MPEDHQLAAHAAAAAARLLLDLRRCPPEGGKALGARGDAESNALILELLRAARPNDGILSEESAPDPARLGERRVWIVDPLDGTREYCEPGRDDWAVHVALAVDGAPAASAVALPALGELFSTP
ncbi:inositol monophosphatase family protein, partial [Chromobacterium piscinae]